MDIAVNTTPYIEILEGPAIPDVMIITTVVISAIVTCIGAVGNTLVIAAIILHKKLRSVHNVFIINLAVADLIVNLIVAPFAIVGAITKGSFFHELEWLCEFLGTVTIMSCGTSICSIVSIAVERYVFICHNDKHATFYNRVSIPFLVAVNWMYPFLVDMPNYEFVGWGGHHFDSVILICSWNIHRSYQTGYIWFFYVCAGFPVTILCFCYVRVHVFVRKARLPKSSNSVKPADKRLFKIILVVLIVFSSMWAPYLVTVILSEVISIPAWILFLSGYMVWANSSINFMIYGFSKDFRDGYTIVKNTIKTGHIARLPWILTQHGGSVNNSNRDV